MNRAFMSWEVVAFAVTVLLVIIILYYVLPPAWMDATFISRLQIGGFKLDWWHISHLWFYMVIGAYHPGHFWKYAALGAGFEVFEEVLGEIQARSGDERRKKQGDEYWFGRWEDVVVNSIGYLIGEISVSGKSS
jgi:hypothetical protein